MWLVATVLERAAIDKSVWQEHTGFIGRRNRKQAVQLDYSDSSGVGRGRSRKVERKREKWDVREKGIKDNLTVGHLSIFPAASLPSCLALAFHPSPSCLLDFLRAHPNSSFSLTLLTHTSLVSIISFTLTPKFILAVLDLSSQPQTPETFPWKSHKILVSPPSPISLPVFWILLNIIIILSAAQARKQNPSDTLFLTCWR